MRTASWFRLLALIFSVFLVAAACGDDDDGEETATGSGGQTEDTEASSDVTVGLVYDLIGRGDKSFNDSAAAGLDRAIEEFGLPEPEELTPDEGGENREELLRLLGDQGTQLIFAIGFLFSDSVTATAPDFPEATFGIIDGVVEADNVVSLTFAEEQGSFLMGAAAALKSQSGTIGFIGGVETDLIKKFEAGYVAGAREINPDIQVEIGYISQPPDFSGFNDPARGKEIGAGQYDAGADVIFHAAGGSGDGLFEAAAEASADGTQHWAIGVDSDQYNLVDASLQPFILTSMLKKVDVAVFDTIQAFVEGGEPGGEVSVFDLEAGGVDYSTTGGFVDDIADQLDELKQQIIDGEIEVPTAP